MKSKQTYAILLAVLAAVFYSVSIPVSKVLLGFAGPTMLAAFLYLGAGAGIGSLFLLRRKPGDRTDRLSRSDLPYTIGMIVLDIMAPILLMNGVERTTAANVSLLNNFEIAATALIAFLVFHAAAVLRYTHHAAVTSFPFSGDRSRNDSDLIVELVEDYEFAVSLLLDDQPVLRRKPGLSESDLLLARGLFSMLYLYGADQRNPGVSVEHDCSICPNKTCFFRAEK